MATLILSAVGGAVGTALGGPIGAAIGQALGALGGSLIDGALFGKTVKQTGPRLSDLKFQASTAGAGVPRVWGKMRVSPQVIWATKFQETQQTDTQGGKGGGGGGTTTVTYSYKVSFALGLCSGPIAGLGRVWADGKLLRLGDYTTRLYLGDETQGADPKIVAVEGADKAPAFRGLAYLVFEDLPLEKFGNRVPQITVEVIRRPPPAGPVLEDKMRAVCLIPGTTEFGYATTQVSVVTGIHETAPDNSHASATASDLVVALDQLEAEAPDVGAVSLVVAWHGTDLRCGVCELRPKVEDAGRRTTPFSWAVGPVTRSSAQVVSTFAGGPAFGGAPADRAVYEGIAALKARGLAVTFYPFLVMDIAPGNTLPNPYGGTGQAAYPWRGRITCHPAAGQPGTVDKTAAAATQVAAFFGAAAPGHFGWDSGSLTIAYSGPAEWSLRRQILHYAKLCQAAGGVDRFIIGSELIGLTTIRSSASAYPAVTQLIALAADVRAILGSGTKISYAADWSEYHSHRPADGSGDVYFNLDPLWADANIDFVGIDNYLPLSDWRDNPDHLDRLAGWNSIYDLNYLKSNVEGGEYHAWYYASQAARDAQTRTTITDTAYGKPWVFGNKDVRNWWLNAHKNRPGGVESASATAWTPQSKPVLFTELGCPAVDKGSNQPNVFIDPKSSESFFPYSSKQGRDDLIQRSHLVAVLDYWDPANGNNPVSSVYGGRMLDWANIFLWTWDARPYPEFPSLSDVWADAGNWRLGHWLTGRLGVGMLRDVVADITANHGAAIDVASLLGLVDGYVSEGIATARDLLGPLMRAYFFDAAETGGLIRFGHRGGAVVASYARGDLVKQEAAKDFALTRAQETELPRAVNLKFYSPDADYRQGAVLSRRLVGAVGATADEALPLALAYSRASGIADAWLFQAHVERERAEFVLPPSALALDAADVIEIDTGSRVFRLRIGEIGIRPDRPVSAVREDPSIYDLSDGADFAPPVPRPQPPAPPLLHFLDLPLLRDEDAAAAHAPRVAAYGAPWTPVAVYRAPAEGSSLTLDITVSVPSLIGALAQPLPSGPTSRWDEASVLTVEVGAGVTLSSRDELSVLNRANAAAVQTPSGRWEILQFRTATLIAARTYALTGLLRGQLGTDSDMAASVPAGRPFVFLGDALARTRLPAELSRSPQFWKWGPSGRPTSDPLYRSATLTFEAIGLRPYAPVQVQGRRDYPGGANDVTLTWVRRTRIGGDSWDQTEVPLGETSEAYEVDIMSGSTVLRTLSAATPSALYTTAQQTADFGSPPASFDVTVYQLSAAYGRGAGRRTTLNV